MATRGTRAARQSPDAVMYTEENMEAARTTQAKRKVVSEHCKNVQKAITFSLRASTALAKGKTTAVRGRSEHLVVSKDMLKQYVQRLHLDVNLFKKFFALALKKHVKAPRETVPSYTNDLGEQFLALGNDETAFGTWDVSDTEVAPRLESAYIHALEVDGAHVVSRSLLVTLLHTYIKQQIALGTIQKVVQKKQSGRRNPGMFVPDKTLIKFFGDIDIRSQKEKTAGATLTRAGQYDQWRYSWLLSFVSAMLVPRNQVADPVALKAFAKEDDVLVNAQNFLSYWNNPEAFEKKVAKREKASRQL